MTRIILIVFVLAIAGMVSLFTVSSREVLQYNDATIDLVNAVDGSFTAVTPFLDRYATGKPVDLAGFATAIERASLLVLDQEARLAAAKVPAEPVCRAFQASLMAYVANSRRILELYQGEVANYIKDHNPAREGDHDAVRKLFAEAIARDAELLAAVKAAQQAMTSKHGIALR